MEENYESSDTKFIPELEFTSSWHNYWEQVLGVHKGVY